MLKPCRTPLVPNAASLAVLGFLAAMNVAPAVTVTSPDGQVAATLVASGGNLTYSVSYRGVTVVENSALGLTVNGTNVGTGVAVNSGSVYAANETFASRHGIHAIATHHYQAQNISVSHTASGVDYRVNVRVFNGGVAFRYEFTGSQTRNVTAEATSFVLPAGSTVWYQGGVAVYENIFTSGNILMLATNATLGPPVTIQLPGTNGWVALTEADLGAFPNPYLTKTANAPGRELRVAYPPNADGTTGGVINSTVTNTPWHVIMVGADLNALVNNDLVESLAPAPDANLFPDGAATSWAVPGRSVWDWLNKPASGITATNAMTNSFWASQLGWEYNTVDEGWALWNNGNPWAQVQQVVNFSTARGVKVLLWKRSSELNSAGQRATFFQQLTNYGVAGFKADFFDYGGVHPASKERVKLQEDILREAAAHKLVVNFHGTAKPTGQFRTYPNLLQFEAVFGKEQFAGQYSHVTPLFVRYLAGPADFTPLALQGGLRGGRSVAFELASMIVLSGPLLTIAERADILAQSPVALLLRNIPPMWDETIVLPQSQMGQTAVLARRKGTEWFVAGMNAGTARNWDIPLTFLTPGVMYQANYIRDTSSIPESGTANATNSLAVAAAVEGGVVAWFYQSPTNRYVAPPNPLRGVGFDFELPFYGLGNVANSTAPGAINAQFIGQQGWSQSTSGGRGAIVVTTSSGLYGGGQALGSGDANNAYIGANTNVVLGKKFRFDLLASGGNKAGVAGFVDVNGDGLFSQTESGVFAGVNDIGGVSYFSFRDTIASGTVYSSDMAANPTDWYRVTVTLNDATRTATMEVTNLTAGGVAVDLNSAAAGTAFSRTWSSAQWSSPTNFVGTLARASANFRLDNIVVIEPATPPTVNLESGAAGNDLQLNWNAGRLQEATNLAGPWTTNPDALSPITVTPTEPQKFFRVQWP
jgi:alpha-glucosidase